MVSIAMALLLVFSGALLLILQVSHSLVHHVALLPVDYRAFLLTLKQLYLKWISHYRRMGCERYKIDVEVMIFFWLIDGAHLI